MASFALDPTAVAPSVEIVNRFRDATSINQSAGGKTLSTSLDSPEKDIYRIRGLITKNLALDTQYTHEVFSCIDEQMRSRAWCSFLNVAVEPRNQLYESACRDGPKTFDAKIRDDSFRTFKGDASFWAKVSEESIIRVLNALSVDFGYVQGMNVLLGPFLYILPEAEAYICMTALLHDRIPRYVLRNLDGAHDGAKLFARSLRLLDAKLFTHLSAKIPDLSIFSLRYMLTLSANSRPLSEVLKLWDAILAVGVHFNILLLCAKLMLMRDALLKEKRGAKIMQLLEDAPVNASQLIDGAFCLLRFIPASLLHEMIAHATSKTLPTTPADSPPPSAGNSTNTLPTANGAEAHSNGGTENGTGTTTGPGHGTHSPTLHRAAIAALGGGDSPIDGYTARSDDSQGSSQGSSSGSGGSEDGSSAGIKLHSASLESCNDSLEGLGIGISAALSASRSIESMVCPGDGSPSRTGPVYTRALATSKDGTD